MHVGQSKNIFSNLPVQNLPRAGEFYFAIDFTNNAQFKGMNS